MTTSLQPVKILEKPVEVVKGRNLAGWAQKSPEPCRCCWCGLHHPHCTVRYKDEKVDKVEDSYCNHLFRGSRSRGCLLLAYEHGGKQSITYHLYTFGAINSNFEFLRWLKDVLTTKI
jgi:hypothetical protein